MITLLRLKLSVTVLILATILTAVQFSLSCTKYRTLYHFIGFDRSLLLFVFVTITPFMNPQDSNRSNKKPPTKSQPKNRATGVQHQSDTTSTSSSSPESSASLKVSGIPAALPRVPASSFSSSSPDISSLAALFPLTPRPSTVSDVLFVTDIFTFGAPSNLTLPVVIPAATMATPPSTVASGVATVTGYGPWEGPVVRYESAYFVDVERLERALRVASRTDYANRPSREANMAQLSGLLGDIIVAQDRRFPETGTYINVTEGALSVYLDTLYQSLTYTESDQGNAQSNRSRYDDMKMSYYKSITSILHILGRRYSPNGVAYDIYNRASFERVNRVKWTGGNAT